MRIVHFDQMFHPDFGDQINILPKYQVKEGHEVYIVTGKANVPHPRFENFAYNENIDEKDRKFEIDSGVKIIRIEIKKFISGRAIYKKGYKELIDNLNPDILFCHFNDTVVGMYYTWISSRLNYPVVFDSHMLLMASKNPLNKQFRLFYKAFITPIIKKNNLKVIRTQNDNYVNNHLGIPCDLSPFISFGSDTTLFYPDIKRKAQFREEYNIHQNDFVVVYTGKLDDSKGGKFLAEAFMEKFYNNKNQNVVLLAIGNSSGDYGNQVEAMFKEAQNRIIRFPTQKYIELAKFYQSADLCVFPKQCSLSFYDAQACGLPIISEDNNINIDRLQNNNGFNFKAGDLNDFRSKITKCIEMDKVEYEKICKNAYNFVKQNYDYKDITKQYTLILEDEYNRFYRKMVAELESNKTLEITNR